MVLTQQSNVYEQCRELILKQEIACGERVTENQLAEMLSVKRGPVRESLIRLEAEGLIRKAPSFGYFVEDYSKEDPNDVIMIRQNLESLASLQAANHATREDIVHLTLIIEEEERALKEGSLEDWARLDREFHRRIVQASGSKILRKIYGLLHLRILPRPTLTDADKEKTLLDHQAILNAIQSHDGETARDYAVQHLAAPDKAEQAET